MSVDEPRPPPDRDDLARAGIGIGVVILIGFAGVSFFENYELSWERAIAGYVIIGAVAGGLVAIATFFGLWWWAAHRYDVWGFTLGWLPSGIAAFALAFLTVPLWGIAAIAAALFAVARSRDET